MTSAEEELFLRCFRAELRHRRPQAMLMWGDLLLERTLAREARQAGIAVVFYLVNASYTSAEAFEHANLVITDSKATADMYRARLQLNVVPVGAFIDAAEVVAPPGTRRYFTFVNPALEKGANLFIALARRAEAALPEAEFLVVEGRTPWPAALKPF